MKEFFSFLDESVTAFHTVENTKNILASKGFTEEKEGDEFKIKRGSEFYVTRNSSSLIAVKIPEGEFKGFHIYAAHTDSPSFRLKENPEITFEESLVRLNVEKYGGMIYSTWFDRPLSVAGRVVVKEEGELKEKLVNINKDLLIIPSVAIHMNRKINEGIEYSVQNDLLPLFSEAGDKGKFLKTLAKAAGVEAKKILSYDLFLYPRQKAGYAGCDKEFIVSSRLDDLACVYGGLKGFTEASSKDYINVLALFDNEEVGSGTKQGADSTFLSDTLERVSEALGLTRSDYLRLVSNSFSVSADNAHAVHPAAAGKGDVTNRPRMNGGIVIKYNGNQKYATDALSAAYFKDICKESKIPYQTYANNSDIAGGSTLGNISTAHVSLNTVDIGLPQLAMHSAVETMGSKDIKSLIEFSRAYFSKQ